MMNDISATEQARILARVRKMMRLANDAGASAGERDNALRMAHATLAKYNLELLEAEATTGKASTAEAREQHDDTFLGYPWARLVAQAAARLLFCMYYFASIRGTGNVRHTFIGRTSNVITAREMARYLVESIHREARAYQRRTYPHLQTQYTSFAQGAMAMVQARCEMLRAESERRATPLVPNGSIERSMSLAIIYRNEETENQKFLEASGANLSDTVSNTRVRDAYAQEAGRRYGARVSLDRQLT